MTGSTVVLCFFVALVNGAGLAGAWADRSWGALGIVFVVLPLCNLGIAVCSSLLTPALKAEVEGFRAGEHLALSWALPLGASVAAVFIASAMGLHGC